MEGRGHVTGQYRNGHRQSWTITTASNTFRTGKKGHILQNLKSASLVAMGSLCDDGCTVILTDKDLRAINNNKVVLRGWRNQRDNLWDIPLQSHTQCMDSYVVLTPHVALYDALTKRPEPSKTQHVHAKNKINERPSKKVTHDKANEVETYQQRTWIKL